MENLPVRRAGFLMVLAYATDLATGQSRDFAPRSCVAAMRLAAMAGMDGEGRRNVYHQALLRYAGCNADSHLLAAAFGDEIALRREVAVADLGDHDELGGLFLRALTRAFADAAPEMRAQAIERGMAEAVGVTVPILAGHCEVASRIGARLGFSGAFCAGLGQLYERWDGHGLPHGLQGETVLPAVRLVTLVQDALSLETVFGRAAMEEKIRARRGSAYEPGLAGLFLANAAKVLDGIEAQAAHAQILALEPQPHAFLDAAACDEACLAIADMIDMRMPFTFGHARAVADLAAAAGRRMNLPQADIAALRRAAFVHDIGELAVPVATWLKAAPLGAVERDAARLHPYHGERALAALGGEGKEVAGLVLRHHERLDGSGYHRGTGGADQSPAARVLAAAEAFQTAREARPHRPAQSDAAAAAALRAAARAGKLDAGAAEAVLAVAGQPSRREPAERLGRLTPREIEVLRLIAAGQTAKEAARSLGIAPKTADNHIQNLYAKIGVTTRAGAALYALEHGLVARWTAAA